MYFQSHVYNRQHVCADINYTGVARRPLGTLPSKVLPGFCACQAGQVSPVGQGVSTLDLCCLYKTYN